MLHDTPRGNRVHIGIFGRRNAGKSSLINALTAQRLAIVSETPGTTTDPVYKSMELHPVGPVAFIDTAGFDDAGELGALRVAKTEDVIDKTDVGVLVVDGAALATGRDASAGEHGKNDTGREGNEPQLALECAWMGRLQAANIPVVVAVNKWDVLTEESRRAVMQELAKDDVPVIPVSAATGMGIEALRQAIADAVPEESLQDRLLGDLIADGGLALLVMPQDIQAPKGRLILPQVQTIRDLLDRRCTAVSTTADRFEQALGELRRAPDLIITDSQCFGPVYEKKPAESLLTSFSILMAASKGDIDVFVDGVSVLDDVIEIAKESRPFRVLIAEACTHVPQSEDIGTVQIPRLLRHAFDETVEITHVRGSDFPDAEGLREYDLIIHCGACMFNRRLVSQRIAAARAAGVPITNYGIFLAKINGILDKVSLPGKKDVDSPAFV